jgi:hypothetical protein
MPEFGDENREGLGENLTEILDVVVLPVRDAAVKLAQFFDQVFGRVLGNGHLMSLHSAKIQLPPG